MNALALSLGLLAALAAGGAVAGDAPAPEGGDLARRIGALPTEVVRGGDCGAFLFGKLDRKGVFTLYSRAKDSKALIMLDGGVLELSRISAEGTALHNQYNSMVFQGGGYTAHVDGAIQEGAKGMAGFLDVTFRLVQGEREIGSLPVSGVVACRERPGNAPREVNPPANPPAPPGKTPENPPS